VRDIYTDLDIQRSTFDYRELWYCRIELDGATLRVSSLLSFWRGPIEAVPAAHGGKAKAKGIAQLADFRFAAAVERRLSVELRNARGVALSPCDRALVSA
jgi:hypothetical protein